MKSKIVLIRHGITEGNEMHMYYGSTDVSLSERGKHLLEKQRDEGLYPISETAQFFTTGMLRTEQTLRIVYGDREHGVIEDLKELDFGEFEMRTYEELNSVPEYQKWITAEDTGKAPPGGESIDGFTQRIRRGFDELTIRNELYMLKLRNHRKDAMTICICHGGVISGIMDYIWPGEYKNFFEWIPDPGHGYVLLVEDGSFKGYEQF
ncbi:MAG: histidine phosphatase family protein [Firmicutes bacterium]|nr:histidine phosphatase family protein [Bacillota bacterium]